MVPNYAVQDSWFTSEKWKGEMVQYGYVSIVRILNISMPNFALCRIYSAASCVAAFYAIASWLYGLWSTGVAKRQPNDN
jgi:hypothetical protein